MQQPIWSIVALVVFAAFVVACAEARNPGTGSTGGAGGESAGTSGTTSGGGGSGGAAGSASAGGSGGSATPTVVFNEIGAVGNDFVELVNIGTAPFDLSGFGVADSDDSGDPKVSEAMRFPDGSSIAPGEHIVIAGEQDPGAEVGPHTTCFPDGPETCYYAVWGISASNGEKLFLLSPDDEVIADEKYPKDGPADTETWGRLPDGTGDFTNTAPTPGSTNAVP